MKNQHALLNGRRRQRGAVLIMFGLTLVVLIGFAGLAIDLGRFFVIKSELQNAMDACALSAASQLKPGANDPNALTRAVAYGKVFITGDDAVKNKVNFQSTVLDPNILEITFGITNGPNDGNNYKSAADADPNTAKFVKCNYSLAGLPIYFMQVLNLIKTDTPFTTQTVSAMAVATRDAPTASCIPVGICKKSNVAPNFGYNIGEWITVVGNGPYGTGNFGWIDFSPPSGGASELAGILKGSEQCDVNQIGARVGAQGVVASLAAPWNSRFGWYQNSITTPIPDFTGFAYACDENSKDIVTGLCTIGNWVWGSNAYDGTSTVALPNYKDAVAVFKPYQNPSAEPPVPQPPGIPSGGYRDPITAAEHQTSGRKDRRIVTAPVVDCSVWTSGANPGNAQPAIEGWACVLMLNPFDLSGNQNSLHRKAKVEFLRPPSDLNSPCSGGSAFAIAPVLTQ